MSERSLNLLGVLSLIFIVGLLMGILPNGDLTFFIFSEDCAFSSHWLLCYVRFGLAAELASPVSDRHFFIILSCDHVNLSNEGPGNDSDLVE